MTNVWLRPTPDGLLTGFNAEGGRATLDVATTWRLLRDDGSTVAFAPSAEARATLLAEKAAPQKGYRFAKYREDQDRDDHGRFADEGGGGGRAAAEGTSPPPPSGKDGAPTVEQIHPRELTIREAMSGTTNWTLALKEKKDEWMGSSYAMHIVPRGDQPGYEQSGEWWYDPTLARMETDIPVLGPRPQPLDTVVKQIPAQAEAGTWFRGMGANEYRAAVKSGQIASQGEYNLGGPEEGLTFWTTDPGQASSYAGGFAPWPHVPTGSNPGYVVQVRAPGKAELERDTERGHRGAIPWDQVMAVYEAHPYAMKPGYVDLIPSPAGLREGSRSSPTTWLHWRQVDHGTAQKGYRKYREDQDRDDHGRFSDEGRSGSSGGREWTTGGGSESALQLAGHTWYHGSTTQGLTAFSDEKISGEDPDVPYTGIWLSSDERTSPAFRNPRAIYTVQASPTKTLTRPEATKFARDLQRETNYEAMFTASGAKGGADFTRMKLLEQGYDAIVHSEKPRINRAELEETGKTDFLLDWRPYQLRKEADGGYDLYQRHSGGGNVAYQHITGYRDPQELVDQTDRVLVMLTADKAKITREGPGWKSAQFATVIKYREDQSRDDHGRFADEGGSKGAASDVAASAPILQGAKPDLDLVRKEHQRTGMVKAEFETLATKEADVLRDTPLVHGTSADAAAAIWKDGAMRSNHAMEGQIETLREEMRDLLGDKWKEMDIAIDMAREDSSTIDLSDKVLEWTDEMGMNDTQEQMQAMGLARAIQGKTYDGDRALGLDRFVFFQHGTVRSEYGSTMVVVDNKELQRPGAFGTPMDIVMFAHKYDPDETWTEEYGTKTMTEYQRRMFSGDDYYKAGGYVMAGRGASHLEVKIPDRVGKDSILGFVVGTPEEHDRLVNGGVPEGKIHYLPYDASNHVAKFQARVRHLQTHGEWPPMDEDSAGYRSEVDPK